MSYDILSTGILVGDTTSGKSQILLQFIDHRFYELDDSVIGFQIGSKVIELSGKQVKLEIRNTVLNIQAGLGSLGFISRSLFRPIAFCILVFDFTRRETFECIKACYEEVKSRSDPVFILVGNNADLVESRSISSDEAQELCGELGIIFYESYAMDYNSVNDLFRIAAQAVVTKRLNSPSYIFYCEWRKKNRYSLY